ncbi:uncharacterized protein LOC116687459, partial [Etheostoma spectabile]|uniref:uncharacterized protein LOC116687459 n=1 Tax=Etheostoma spectabile TaxID=54343 RepID=UPI0013AF6419
PLTLAILHHHLVLHVTADYCSSYWETDGYYHDTQLCGSRYGLGNCNRKYRCSEHRLTEEKRERCTSPGLAMTKKSHVSNLLGSILGPIFPSILCLGLIICCVAPCSTRRWPTLSQSTNHKILVPYLQTKGCLQLTSSCKKNTLTIVNVPQQPLAPSGHQPGYQPVPAQTGYGGLPFPTAPAPPSNMKSTELFYDIYKHRGG